MCMCMCVFVCKYIACCVSVRLRHMTYLTLFRPHVHRDAATGPPRIAGTFARSRRHHRSLHTLRGKVGHQSV